MRAFAVTAPHETAVIEVDPPEAGAGQVVIDVHRVGICGTDVEFFTGEMAYLHQGHAHFPMRLGHEWMGVVRSIGNDVDPSWLGRRVTGDTMLGCGQCRRCLSGRQHVCARGDEDHRPQSRPARMGQRGAIDGLGAACVCARTSVCVSPPLPRSVSIYLFILFLFLFLFIIFFFFNI